MSNDKIFAMPFAKVFPLLIAKKATKILLSSILTTGVDSSVFLLRLLFETNSSGGIVM